MMADCAGGGEERESESESSPKKAIVEKGRSSHHRSRSSVRESLRHLFRPNVRREIDPPTRARLRPQQHDEQCSLGSTLIEPIIYTIKKSASDSSGRRQSTSDGFHTDDNYTPSEFVSSRPQSGSARGGSERLGFGGNVCVDRMEKESSSCGTVVENGLLSQWSGRSRWFIPPVGDCSVESPSKSASSASEMGSGVRRSDESRSARRQHPLQAAAEEAQRFSPCQQEQKAEVAQSRLSDEADLLWLTTHHQAPSIVIRRVGGAGMCPETGTGGEEFLSAQETFHSTGFSTGRNASNSPAAHDTGGQAFPTDDTSPASMQMRDALNANEQPPPSPPLPTQSTSAKWHPQTEPIIFYPHTPPNLRTPTQTIPNEGSASAQKQLDCGHPSPPTPTQSLSSTRPVSARPAMLANSSSKKLSNSLQEADEEIASENPPSTTGISQVADSASTQVEVKSAKGDTPSPTQESTSPKQHGPSLEKIELKTTATIVPGKMNDNDDAERSILKEDRNLVEACPSASRVEQLATSPIPVREVSSNTENLDAKGTLSVPVASCEDKVSSFESQILAYEGCDRLPPSPAEAVIASPSPSRAEVVIASPSSSPAEVVMASPSPSPASAYRVESYGFEEESIALCPEGRSGAGMSHEAWPQSREKEEIAGGRFGEARRVMASPSPSPGRSEVEAIESMVDSSEDGDCCLPISIPSLLEVEVEVEHVASDCEVESEPLRIELPVSPNPLASHTRSSRSVAESAEVSSPSAFPSLPFHLVPEGRPLMLVQQAFSRAPAPRRPPRSSVSISSPSLSTCSRTSPLRLSMDHRKQDSTRRTLQSGVRLPSLGFEPFETTSYQTDRATPQFRDSSNDGIYDEIASSVACGGGMGRCLPHILTPSRPRTPPTPAVCAVHQCLDCGADVENDHRRERDLLSSPPVPHRCQRRQRRESARAKSRLPPPRVSSQDPPSPPSPRQPPTRHTKTQEQPIISAAGGMRSLMQVFSAVEDAAMSAYVDGLRRLQRRGDPLVALASQTCGGSPEVATFGGCSRQQCRRGGGGLSEACMEVTESAWSSSPCSSIGESQMYGDVKGGDALPRTLSQQEAEARIRRFVQTMTTRRRLSRIRLLQASATKIQRWYRQILRSRLEAACSACRQRHTSSSINRYTLPSRHPRPSCLGSKNQRLSPPTSARKLYRNDSTAHLPQYKSRDDDIACVRRVRTSERDASFCSSEGHPRVRIIREDFRRPTWLQF